MRPDALHEAVDAAAGALLIELAFLVPRGTDFKTHPISNKLVAYKEAIEQRERAALAASPGVPQWQPIETAPKEDVCWFWVRPKDEDEAYQDTSGRPILFSAGKPRAWVGKYKCWSALETADFWMPYQTPAPPEVPHG